MTKYLKHNCFTTLLIAGISLVTLFSCEKDTGDLGLNTLPSSDGITVHYDSVNISGYTIKRDSLIETNSYVEMLGSVVDDLGNGILDTITSEVLIPLYYPVWHNSPQNISNIESVSFKFSDKISGSKYVYGDTLSELVLLLEEYTGNAFTFIDTIKYVYHRDAESFSHELPKDFTDKIIASVQKTYTAYPFIDENNDQFSDNYTIDEEKEIRKYFADTSGFDGLRLRICNVGDHFISRIVSPHIEIKYKMDSSKYSMSFRIVSFGTTNLEDDVMAPLSIMKHTANLDSKSGALIQGFAGHKTVLDFSFLDSWISDSTNHTFMRASIDFPFLQNPDSRDPLAELQFRITALDTAFNYAGGFNPENSKYSFDIEQGLNIILSRRVPISDYIFELRCPNNNKSAQKTFLDYLNGNQMNLTYTKY